MSASVLEENKAVVMQIFAEVISAEKTTRAGKYVTVDYVEHQQLPGAGARQSIEVTQACLAMMPRAFPDDPVAIEDVVAGGTRW